MSDNVEFEISMAAQWWRDPPKVNIYIDNTLVDFEVFVDASKDKDETKVFKFNKELEEGEHSIVVEYLNKTNADTVIDEEGNILKDQLLFIENVSIDDIELGNVVRKCSAFYPTAERLASLDWLNPELKGQIVSGHPGKWILKFSTPTYLWLLENL
jgi:hypothetical protein